MKNKLIFLGLFLVLLLSGFSITLLLEPSAIFSDTPVYTDDYSMHLSHCLTTKRFLQSAGKCWGYDPFFLAGYPSGALVNADNKFWELLVWILSPYSEGFAFKLYLLLFMILYPFFVYASACNFKLSKVTSFLAAIFSMVYFHLSIALDFVAWGMLSYVFMCFFSLYILSLFYQVVEEFSWKRYFVLLLFSPLLLLMHILSPIHLFIPILIVYALNLKKLTFSRHFLIFLILVIVLLLNSYWLIPMVKFLPDKTTRPENYNFSLQINNLSEVLNVYLKQKTTILYKRVEELNSTFMDVMILILSLCGLYYWLKEKKVKLCLPFAGGTLFIFVVAYYGSHIKFLQQFQPQRFTVPLNILLLIPATEGLVLTFRNLLKDKSIITFIYILFLTFSVLYQPLIKPLLFLYNHPYYYRLIIAIPAPIKQLLASIEKNTNQQGRILLEDSEWNSGQHQYYGTHLPALFPEFVRREYLSAPRPLYPIKHSYASFTGGLLFEKRIEDYSLEELKDDFNLFNVKWIICWSKESKRVFNNLPGYIHKLEDIDRFTLYEVNREPSFFIKGKGLVKSDYNRLELNQIIPEDSEVILSYHWMKYLKTDPPRKLERVFIGNDPVGFIRIVDPPESLVVFNGY